jgi:cytochrome c biogenesis protein CcdA/thiol-disulfide isomerase/thioredoxin
MTLLVLSYLAGMLTILAPCILPVVPFVFARADQAFVRSGLPLLAGMVLSFVAVATLATVGGAWVAEANDAGRVMALTVLAAMGLGLLSPRLAERAARPWVWLGSRLTEHARPEPQTTGRAVLSSFTLGAATGLLWAPCAGPVLGLVLTTAAIQGASLQTSAFLFAYAAGAATSLGLSLWVGTRLLSAMRRVVIAGAWIRRGMGVAVLAGVSIIALGLDTDLLVRIPSNGGAAIEQELLQRLQPKSTVSLDQPARAHRVSYRPQIVAANTTRSAKPAAPQLELPVEGLLPDLAGATSWLNSAPLTAQSLRGKVVLVDFWTFSCINCQRALPHVRAWAEKYKDQGLVVIGVHAPEFAFERKVDRVQRAANDMGLNFPIAIDNNFAIWKSFSNQYWPANYFIDAKGQIRFHHFGEGEYERSEQVIQQLLEEAKTPANGGRTESTPPTAHLAAVQRPLSWHSTFAGRG